MRIYLVAAALALLSGCAQQAPLTARYQPTWVHAYPIPTMAFDSAASFADHEIHLIDPVYTYHGTDRT